MVSNGLAPWHLVLLVAVAVVVFGSKRLPEAARGLGQALRVFRAEVSPSPPLPETGVTPPDDSQATGAPPPDPRSA